MTLEFMRVFKEYQDQIDRDLILCTPKAIKEVNKELTEYYIKAVSSKSVAVLYKSLVAEYKKYYANNKYCTEVPFEVLQHETLAHKVLLSLHSGI